MNEIASFIALNRFGFGVAPGDLRAVGSDPAGWVERQVVRRPSMPRGLARFPGSETIIRELAEARLVGPEKLRKVRRGHFRNTFAREVAARAQQLVKTEQPFAERMVLFWSNHFTVSRTKANIGVALPAFEREAIRPHIFSRFEDMLLAVVGHPCMLTYLDNTLSVGPNSRVGRRTRRTLNENLAREILELHTLGVGGGYSQSDVTEFAKTLTGWTHGGMVGRRSKQPVSGEFVFRAIMHEPGRKTILGRTYREAGVEEARLVLRHLASHPSTAWFLATKLVRHFVSDEPPRSAVEQIARVYQDTGGDLARVSRALVELEAVWRDPLPKVKTPYELLISTYRGLGIEKPITYRALKVPLRTLGREPFNAPSPQGWPDTASHWLTPESLLRRIEWLRVLAARVPLAEPPAVLLERLIGPVASPEVRQMVDLAPSPDAAIALVTASAEFQRR